MCADLETQFNDLGGGLPLFFLFFKILIYSVSIMFIISGIYNFLTNITGILCFNYFVSKSFFI